MCGNDGFAGCVFMDRWLQAKRLCNNDAYDTNWADKAFCWQVFFLKEKLASLSGDDFDILDANNSPAFKMQASAVSLAEKRVLKNPQNQPVCSLKKKVCWLNQLSCTICCLLMSCASKFSCSVHAWQSQKKCTAVFTPAQQQMPCCCGHEIQFYHMPHGQCWSWSDLPRAFNASSVQHWCHAIPQRILSAYYLSSQRVFACIDVYSLCMHNRSA